MVNYACLVVEDEEADVRELQQMLAQVPLLKQIDVCSSATEAFQCMIEKNYNVIFLDIQLPGMTGLDWLHALPNRPPVIITTAFPEFAIDCFDLDVADYLLKPFTLRRLNRAIYRALDVRISDRNTADQGSIYLHADRRLQQFRYSDILYLEANGAYTKVHTNQGVVTVSESISMLEEWLPKRFFLRIQKSYIVNIDKLTAVELRQVWLQNIALPIGKLYREPLRQLLHETAR